ncbi:MAG: TldD/PmbA family protein, partial [Candidatus Margulisbacteria bacterium]|nr:TldD/PmbA family protein [Candidatus Margulisiibacteriota bacterium]
RLYAGLLKQAATGNGRRESYRYTPLPRMTNTYLANGTADPQAIIRSVEKGLFVKKLGGGQVDVTNGNFVFEITEGYLLKDGQIGRPVRGATLVGNGIEVLQGIDMVGNDLSFIPGLCGKGQTAPVSDGQPTVRIPSLIVGGQKC